MHVIYSRLIQEWQELDIAYPQWLSTIALNDAYYVVTLVVMSLACFEVGLVIGIVWTVV